jgi:hypothetical protein
VINGLNPASGGTPMKLKYWIPFLLFIIPTPIITYFMWETHVWEPFPREQIKAIAGLFVMWFFVGVTYFGGIHAVLKDFKAQSISSE